MQEMTKGLPNGPEGHNSCQFVPKTDLTPANSLTECRLTGVGGGENTPGGPLLLTRHQPQPTASLGRSWDHPHPPRNGLFNI